MKELDGGKKISEALSKIKESTKDEPIFTRGAETELQTMTEVEQLKSTLAHMKIHIPARSLQLGIIMPKDIVSHGDYPKPIELIWHDPWPKEKEEEEGKKKKKKKVDKKKKDNEESDDENKLKKLEMNEKL